MSKKILVVDDEPEIVNGTRRILEKRGYTVLGAFNGKQGLETALNERPDLILTDVIMPEMDGFALYKELKKSKATADIPVLIVTARGPMEDSFKVIGVDGFISKPFLPEDLLSEIEHIFSINSHRQLGAKDGQPLEIKRILVVGRETAILEESMMEARRAGYDVDVTLKGADAVSKMVQVTPDLVFIDVQVDDVPIDEIIQIFRRLPKFESKPIVGYSFYKTEEFGDQASRERIMAIQEASEKFIEAGGNEYIGRYNAHAFIETTMKILAGG